MAFEIVISNKLKIRNHEVKKRKTQSKATYARRKNG